jgi:CxxC motif-containing protein (DUF1111 family)
MKTSNTCRPSRAGSIALLLLALAGPCAAAGELADLVGPGREIFVKQFVAKEAHPGSDGLGPLFNHSSCAACHRQGALGGAGGVEFNVRLISAQLARPGKRPSQSEILTALRAVHPAFVGTDGKIVPSIILHRFGPGERYTELRAELGAAEISLSADANELDALQRQHARDPLPTSKTKGPLSLVHSQRNTTALFGAGLIDGIPDGALHNLAALQAKQGEVSGRVPPVFQNKVGRFGWRGQQEHLHDFVLGACANELGLQVPGNQQPMNPLKPDYRPAGLDLTDDECQQLTAFIASLPPPQFALPESIEQREIVAQGRTLFGVVGCAACHVERIGPVDGLYSDLLLHDMGAALTDPVLAAPTLTLVKTHPLKEGAQGTFNVNSSIPPGQLPGPQLPPRQGGYSGGSMFGNLALFDVQPTIKVADQKARVVNEFLIQQSPLDREWRTPPLWGLADSAPYLHDGRAPSMLEAIALHGGEADACTKRYFALHAGQRLAVLEFLKCLRAP